MIINGTFLEQSEAKTTESSNGNLDICNPMITGQTPSGEGAPEQLLNGSYDEILLSTHFRKFGIKFY